MTNSLKTHMKILRQVSFLFVPCLPPFIFLHFGLFLYCNTQGKVRQVDYTNGLLFGGPESSLPVLFLHSANRSGMSSPPSASALVQPVRVEVLKE